MGVRALCSFLVSPPLPGPDGKGQAIKIRAMENRVDSDSTMGMAAETGQVKEKNQKRILMADHHVAHLVPAPGYIGEDTNSKRLNGAVP